MRRQRRGSSLFCYPCCCFFFVLFFVCFRFVLGRINRCKQVVSGFDALKISISGVAKEYNNAMLHKLKEEVYRQDVSPGSSLKKRRAVELIDACFIQRKFVTASMKRPFAQYDEDSVREFRKRMEEFDLTELQIITLMDKAPTNMATVHAICNVPKSQQERVYGRVQELISRLLLDEEDDEEEEEDDDDEDDEDEDGDEDMS